MRSRIIVPFLLGVAVSFYFFPIGFTFLPANINSKMILAVIGALMFIWDSLVKDGLHFSNYTIGATILAVLFSISCYFSAVENYTDDMTYATYFASFFTWLGGAYAVCRLLSLRYGKADLSVIITYLMWVGVAQCVTVLLVDNVPAFKTFVDAFFRVGQDFLERINRKYGLGASLDPAGVRFTIILILLAHQLSTKVIPSGNTKTILWYVFAFSFITVVGNMVSRTTSVGAVAGLAYVLYYLARIDRGTIKSTQLRTIFLIAVFLLITIPSITYLYNTNENFHSDLRFAFEGFFNWRETGTWRTASTDKLNSVMWIWPEDPKTWAIGSGLFGHFEFSTDIGYCRFVLYCGLLGFSIFSLFFIYNAIQTDRKFHEGWLLSLMLLALPFIIWIKVSTDIFQIYALFMCAEVATEKDRLIL